LLQRGRGGGLTGALGGAGGASAFGVKAGDIFTRITAIAVLLWIVLCAVTCFWYLPSKLDITSNPSPLTTTSDKSGINLGGMGGMGSMDPAAAATPDADKTPEGEKKPDELPNSATRFAAGQPLRAR
jgi:preprotein translocase subunit SecG